MLIKCQVYNYGISPGYCFVLSYDRIVPAALMPADLCLSQGDGCARCLRRSHSSSCPAEATERTLARSKAKLSLHQSHAIVSEYVVFLLSDSSDASHFRNASEIRPVVLLQCSEYRRLRCTADLAARGAAPLNLMKFNQ